MRTFHLLQNHLQRSRRVLSWTTFSMTRHVPDLQQTHSNSHLLLPLPHPTSLLPHMVGLFFKLRLSQISLWSWIASRALLGLHTYLASGTIAHPMSVFGKHLPHYWTRALTSASPVTSNFWSTSSKSHHFQSQLLSPVTLPPLMTAALVGATSHCNSQMALRIGRYASTVRKWSKQSYLPRPFLNQATSLLHGHRQDSRTVTLARFISTATMDSSPCVWT